MSRSVDQVGHVLGGRYRLIRPLGTGASAHVYVAEDTTLRRPVALKLLHAALADDDAFLRRFEAEARVVGALRHPNIVRVYDWGEDESGPFLVMELLEGGSLRSLLDRGHLLTPAQAARVGAETAHALDYAHRRGLVHRDIKPANLLFDDEGRVSIADFGLARALAEASWTEPSGAVLGTARYAAPEQVTGATLDGAADVYSLGLVLIEAVTGKVPFATDTTIGTLMARVDQPLPLPEELGNLGPVLAPAGVADPALRIDAGTFAASFESVAARLPAPEPLPLAGPLITGEVEEDADITLVPEQAMPFDHETASSNGGAVDDDRLPTRTRPRRRTLWLPAIAVGLAAIVLLAVVSVTALRAATPRHAVPLLTGTEVDVKRTLSPLHFHLAVTRAYDDHVPAGEVISQNPRPGIRLRERKAVAVVLSLGPVPVPVPDLTGATVDQARQRLQGAGLSLGNQTPQSSTTVRAGQIISWNSAGGKLPKFSPVDVVVSTGPPVVAVPDVRTRSFTDAQAALRSVGLGAVEVDVFSDTVPKGQVIATNPGPGGQATVGATVTVTVSKGQDLVPVPDVTHLSVSDATTKLEAAGFSVSGVSGSPDRTVSATSPPAGAMVKRGSSVGLRTG